VISIEERPTAPTSEDWLQYRVVCSDTCQDEICVALAYDNDTIDEPDLPLYRNSDTSDCKGGDELNSSREILEESCPTNNMPGAFKD
jgi:hypothetical protein